VASPTVPYSHLVPAFVLNGVGMSLFFAPMASTVLGAVGPGEEGIASGVNNAIRELGGVLGIAVLASVFSAAGSYASGQAFVRGLVPAVAAGAAIVGFAVVAALSIPRRSRPAPEAELFELEMSRTDGEADVPRPAMAGALSTARG